MIFELLLLAIGLEPCYSDGVTDQNGIIKVTIESLTVIYVYSDDSKAIFCFIFRNISFLQIINHNLF